MPSKLDSALTLARRGFRVFPLPVDDVNVPSRELKTPHMKNWPQLATSNKKQIRAWWAEADYNIGLATGRGIVVLDYDMKDGQLGAKALATHDMLGLPMDGLKVETPTGGVHLYFKTEQTIHNSASKIAKNVDVRGDGGYVVAPGSTIHGVPYAATLAELHELPDWMEKLATAVRTRSTVDAKESLVELDQPQQIEQARSWLATEAPEALEGSGGDATTYKVACRVRDFGVTKETCLELLANHWNDEKAIPSWSLEELEAKVRNAYSYATLPAGSADAKGEFGIIDISELEAETDEANEKPKRGLFYVKFNDAAAEALENAAEPLVDGLLDCGTLSTLYGRPKGGKTFNALDIEFHIAAGIPWNGRKVKQGLVIHIAAEGGLNIKKRIRALKVHYGVEDDIPLALVPCPVNLLDSTREGDTRKLIKLIKQAEADYGQKAVLVVIDTLSRALAGGDENSSTDMGTFIRHVDKIREHCQCHLMIVHHSGKDRARGMRGWSGMLAALDTEIEIVREDQAVVGTLFVTNQRDMECLDPMRFALKEVAIGLRPDGVVANSCVVDFSAEAIAKDEFDSADAMTEQEKDVLDAMRAVWAKTPIDDKTRQKTPMTNGEINEFLVDQGIVHKPMDKSQLGRVLTKLTNVGSIRKDKRGQWVVVEVDQVDKVDNSTSA
jgi:hypothetical protein